METVLLKSLMLEKKFIEALIREQQLT